MIDDKDFIGKEFPQKCGDSLLVLEKSNKKQNTNYLYKCKFIKYSYQCFVRKSMVINGSVVNPLIEENEFIGKEFLQNCGDILKVIKKSNEKINSISLFECEFQKYPYKCLCSKQKILSKNILNPLIEENEFIGKIFPQNCGDDLKVIKKTDKKNSSNHKFLFECEFQKYPYKLLAEKGNILKGTVLNPEIENQEFIGKIFPQNCGDSLKVLRKSDKKNNHHHYLYECEFIKKNIKILTTKSSILNGNVLNNKIELDLIKNKNNLIKYIQENFKDKKPTLQELAKSLTISNSLIGKQIINFNLKDYISYSYKGLENEIYNFLNQYNNICINSYYIKDIKKEIDIYIPNYNFGIEINGNYWHSNLYLKNNYHQEKSLLIKEKNIFLIHIFEYEWENKQEIIKSLIKSKLGIFIKRIYARKCVIKELDYKTYAQFCNENHLQGECGAKVKLGLFYENELVQIMSFGSPRFTDKYEWEIIRECSKLGYYILGGKEKLWKYFLNKYNPKSCISYCDFSKFTGNSYLKLGFKKERLNSPGFVWWDQKLNITYLRTPSKHQEFKNKYLKIYDAGQLVFVWNNK